MTVKKNVLLFGAGAVIDWGAPFTYELTEIVRKSGWPVTSSNTTITEFIYQHLKSSGKFEDTDINFETIINVIEELIVYYSYFDGFRKLPSIVSSFFTPQFENEILNFSIEGEKADHGFKLEIPKGKRSEFAKSAVNNETPAQFFLLQLLAELLTGIITRISKYSYHSRNNSNVITPKNQVMNDLFSTWAKSLVKNGVLRMYTLNYDRNFKIILEKSTDPLTVFEGFDTADYVDYGASLTADIPRILRDSDSHTHYNLHGSSFWGTEARDQSQLPNPSFYLSATPVLPVNAYEQAVWQSEKGKTLMLTSIITGYQKTQRGIFPPFRQMQAAFDSDCCFADTIYIIGYSFGDEHINASIKLAVQYNPNVKIIIVDPAFTKNGFDLDVAIKIFSAAGDSGAMRATTIDKNLHSFFGDKFIVHTKIFKDYLESAGTDPFANLHHS